MQILVIYSTRTASRNELQTLTLGATFIFSVLKIKREIKHSIVMFWFWLAYVCLVGFQETLGVYLRRALSGKTREVFNFPNCSPPILKY